MIIIWLCWHIFSWGQVFGWLWWYHQPKKGFGLFQRKDQTFDWQHFFCWLGHGRDIINVLSSSRLCFWFGLAGCIVFTCWRSWCSILVDPTKINVRSSKNILKNNKDYLSLFSNNLRMIFFQNIWEWSWFSSLSPPYQNSLQIKDRSKCIKSINTHLKNTHYKAPVWCDLVSVNIDSLEKVLIIKIDIPIPSLQNIKI